MTFAGYGMIIGPMDDGRSISGWFSASPHVPRFFLTARNGEEKQESAGDAGERQPRVLGVKLHFAQLHKSDLQCAEGEQWQGQLPREDKRYFQTSCTKL